jgi:hypothetical protein
MEKEKIIRYLMWSDVSRMSEARDNAMLAGEERRRVETESGGRVVNGTLNQAVEDEDWEVVEKGAGDGWYSVTDADLES